MNERRPCPRRTSPWRATALLLALCACTTARPPDVPPGSAPPAAPAPAEPAPADPAPAKPPVEPEPATPALKPAEPKIELTPAEQATDDVSGFMGAYISAIHRARARAKELNEPVRIRIDRDAHRVTLTRRDADEGREPVRDAFTYAASVQILKEPESVVVQPDEVIAFTGRDFKHPLPQKETAHVLAWVPKFAPHAFFRFARGKREFLAQQTSYIDETSD